MPPLQLPESDVDLSPHTGYTRAHWEAAADGLLHSAWRFASPAGARLDFPGPPSGSGPASDGLEGFARSMLIAAFRVAGSGGDDPHGWLGRYARGLAAGTSARSGERWLPIRDHDDGGQPLVESASIALSLRLTRPWLWDRLEPGVQDEAADWLRGALTAVPAPNNWYLFPAMVAGFLEAVGRGDTETVRVRERADHLLDAWYRGDGWYSDGEGRAFDHYNGWALHFYPVLDAHLDGRRTHHADRLREFLGTFGYWFGADGAPLYMGRSMTYRFAASASIALGAVTGDSPLPGGQSRRLLSGSLKYFLDRGSLNGHGLLSLGWHGEHAPTLQRYSGPASPLWAAKAFACLLAPADAPLWTETERGAPVEQGDRVLASEAPGFLVQTTSGDGIARLHNHGSDKIRPPAAAGAAGADPLYNRLGYSTASGPTDARNEADNHVSLIWRGHRSARRQIVPIGAAAHGDWGWAGSWHQPVFDSSSPTVPGLRIESYVVVHGNAEVRIDRVVDALYEMRAEHTGWAVGEGGPVSELEPLAGWEGAGRVIAPAGTAFASFATMPRLGAPVAGTRVFVALARLRGADTPPVGVDDVEVHDDVVRFRFDPAGGGEGGTAPAIAVDLTRGTVEEVRA
ncbi:DUF2264 domain-containing protein [Zhihengliuella salsuginis]|uniref:DUF2264 domain-containing protein n=1 Tax=Zhihengliuella salsuginis TaxID=578222 RepID=A0ABQ3GJX0_9MICC|nr:DUF2264 domain-containing protein [Zhihengliuella salsuginis]GHD06917.1 hypothetical protein GCM10008096_17410 [Zhihengliuella salsuginis]